jgi:hypothetical protein
MSDSESPKLPGDPDTLTDLGPCENGLRHVRLSREGESLGVAHMRQVEEGKPLHDCSLYYTDSGGKIVGSVRIGKGPAKVSTPQYRNGWDAIFGHDQNTNSQSNKDLN